MKLFDSPQWVSLNLRGFAKKYGTSYLHVRMRSSKQARANACTQARTNAWTDNHFFFVIPPKRPFKLQQWEQRNKICSNCTIHENNLIHGKKINLKIFHFLVSMQWLFANYFVLFLCKSDCHYWYFGLSHFHLPFLWAPHYNKQELLKILPGMSEHASGQKNLSPLTGSNPRPSVHRSAL